MQHSYPETDLGERPDVCWHSGLTFYSHMTPFTEQWPFPPARFGARTLTLIFSIPEKEREILHLEQMLQLMIRVTLNSIVKTNIGCKEITENRLQLESSRKPDESGGGLLVPWLWPFIPTHIFFRKSVISWGGWVVTKAYLPKLGQYRAQLYINKLDLN